MLIMNEISYVNKRRFHTEQYENINKCMETAFDDEVFAFPRVFARARHSVNIIYSNA